MILLFRDTALLALAATTRGTELRTEAPAEFVVTPPALHRYILRR